MTKPTVLISNTSYQRLKQKLPADLNYLLLDEALTRLTPDGQLEPTEDDGCEFDYAWFSHDIMAQKLGPRFFRLLLNSKQVSWLQTLNAGMDNAVFRRLFDQGLSISRSDAQSVAISEYVLANVLAHYQGVFQRRELQLQQQWLETRFTELSGKHWLIIGYGNIGQAIAKRASAFDCQITAVNRDGRAAQYAHRSLRLEQINQHLADIDIVVIACPLTEQTKQLVNNDFLSRLKTSALIVNIGRGEVINETELIQALEHETIAGAILDVFTEEPLIKDSPLWHMPQVIVSAHSSHAGDGTFGRGDDLFLDNLQRQLSQQPLRYQVTEYDVSATESR